MNPMCFRIAAMALGIVALPWAGAALAAQSCNQVEVAPKSEVSVSVLLPDTASGLQTQLRVRNAHTSGPVDGWTVCPTAEPYGACAGAHADVSTLGTSKTIDPDDGMQLVAFRLKNGSASAKRDVRLCVQYQMP
jgi:hypothetical protein